MALGCSKVFLIFVKYVMSALKHVLKSAEAQLNDLFSRFVAVVDGCSEKFGAIVALQPFEWDLRPCKTCLGVVPRAAYVSFISCLGSFFSCMFFQVALSSALPSPNMTRLETVIYFLGTTVMTCLGNMKKELSSTIRRSLGYLGLFFLLCNSSLVLHHSLLLHKSGGWSKSFGAMSKSRSYYVMFRTSRMDESPIIFAVCAERGTFCYFIVYEQPCIAHSIALHFRTLLATKP